MCDLLKKGLENIMRKSLALFLLVGALATSALAQIDSVAIKFRYQPQATYVRVHFPGTFNSWGPNNLGLISAGTPSQADSLEASTGLWVKTVPLAFGTYQYKIYRQLSATPNDYSWIADPLNRVVIPPDQNSQLVVDSLLLFQICASPYTIEGTNSFVVKTSHPNLSAGIFQPAGAPAVAVTAYLDGTPIADPGSRDGGIFTWVPQTPLADGKHTFALTVSAGAKTKNDSVTFEVRARMVQIQSPDFGTWKNTYITTGILLKPGGSGLDSSISSVSVAVNQGAPRTIAALNGVFTDTTSLVDGLNTIVVSSLNGYDTVNVVRRVNHSPSAHATALLAGSTVTLDASGTTDPDGQTVTNFIWLDDAAVPLGLSGKTGASVDVAKPPLPGEFYFGLIAIDPDGNRDTARSYFIVNPNGTLENPTIAGNPSWAKQARVYFLFPKAASSAGTINAAALRLQTIHDLGFSVIWMMPVMDNAIPIDNGYGIGYNIVDFYNVAPEYGTNLDFKNFVAQAHALGMKVILDVTPNHTGRYHPWADNARTLGQRSPYWPWYQHAFISHNDNGLGQSMDAYGFVYYTGFSDQLLNFDWTDIDARAEMINVYRTWVREFDLDGFRFDVYWGPHRRYGEKYMGKPVRDALKHIKPDILLLGEDGGTGYGTETIYADYSSAGINGGVDAAYDFKLYFDNIRNFGFSAPAFDGLNGNIDNGGFYPGPDALYMRFMESQDEDRIYYLNPSPSTYYDAAAQTAFAKTMPMASVIFTCPGFPMIWNGQEVGWGYGIAGAKEARNRSVINWDFQGKSILSPHYQKLAQIRGQFPAFTQHKQDTNGDGSVNASDLADFVRVATGNNLVYGFTRPYSNQNGLTVVNAANTSQSVTLDLTGTNVLRFSGDIQVGSLYFVNNLYDNTSQQVTGSSLNALSVSLPAYGTGIYTVSVTHDTVAIEHPVLAVRTENTVPQQLSLEQNFPNPFNPTTVISFHVPAVSDVRLVVYDLLGRELAVLVHEKKGPGSYEAKFDATGLASGVYLYRLVAGGYVESRKMMLLK